MELESRMEFQHRLEREGRWKAVRIWMDNWRRDKSTTPGMSKQQIREMVWDEAEKVFPPIPVEDQMAETWIPEGHVKKGHPDPLRDLLWCYEFFAVKDVKAADAPNTGAWAMLMWARKNREKFFDHLMTKGCTPTAGKMVKEVAEKKATGSAKKEEPEDPGVKRLNRIFQKTREARKAKQKKQESDGSKPDGRVRSGTSGPGVPVVRSGTSGPGREQEVEEEDS